MFVISNDIKIIHMWIKKVVLFLCPKRLVVVVGESRRRLAIYQTVAYTVLVFNIVVLARFMNTHFLGYPDLNFLWYHSKTRFAFKAYFFFFAFSSTLVSVGLVVHMFLWTYLVWSENPHACFTAVFVVVFWEIKK